MQKITLEFTNDDARSIAYFLRKRYSTDARTGLKRLCGIAVRQEVAQQAQKELDENGYQVSGIDGK